MTAVRAVAIRVEVAHAHELSKPGVGRLALSCQLPVRLSQAQTVSPTAMPPPGVRARDVAHAGQPRDEAPQSVIGDVEVGDEEFVEPFLAVASESPSSCGAFFLLVREMHLAARLSDPIMAFSNKRD